LGTILESGEGSTKKEAKRNAAKKVYEKLEEGDVAIFSTVFLPNLNLFI